MENEITIPNRFPARRMIGGLVLITIGGIFLLDELDLTRFGRVWNLWPLILIVLAIARIVDPAKNERRSSGLWLLAIGTWLLIGSLGLFGFSYGTSWPLLLVFFGAIIIGQSIFEGPRNSTTEEERNGRQN
jgi:hypothetical protein